MSGGIPAIGIDFGATNSSMAWYDPRTESTGVILNAEGQAKTPSQVRFGENETLVGEPVEKLPEDVSMDRVRRGLWVHRREHQASQHLAHDLKPNLAVMGTR